ncbi:hypothetical protein H1R20_g6971, partial [Candolleomyces eurysporus]
MVSRTTSLPAVYQTPNKPLSNRVKKHKASKGKEARLRQATKLYLDAKLLGRKRALRDVADEFGVSKSALERSVNGKGQSMLEFNATKKKLTNVEEQTLVNFILKSADRGFPLCHGEIMQYANVLCRARLGADCEPVGPYWIYSFIDRWHEVLQTHWSKPLDTQRARSLNPEAVQSWFKLVEEFVVKAGIAPENIYGMDESGFPLAYSGKERVVGARGTKTQHKQGGADRENVTAVVTICADGGTIPPLLIFKGKNLKDTWAQNNQVGAYSHYTIPFIEFARTHNIVLLGYPAHCTHALQGLNVVCFSRMKDNWKQAIVSYEAMHNQPATKREFTRLFSEAYIASFTPETVKAAFRETGVHLFNPSVISQEQMKPSLTTSIKGSFSLPQPSPVRAVMASMRINPPTALATSPSTHTRHFVARTDSPDFESTTQPSTPSLRRPALSLDADPLLYTPTKRMRMMYAALSSTSSGSILVSKVKITSETRIAAPVLEAMPTLPQPDWTLANGSPSRKTYQQLLQENEELRAHLQRASALHRAQEGIIEGAHTSMVIQNLHFSKLNSALHGKEKPQEASRTFHIDSSKGSVFSSDMVLEGL